MLRKGKRLVEGCTYGKLAHDGLELLGAQQLGIAQVFQLRADGADGAVRGCGIDAHCRYGASWMNI